MRRDALTRIRTSASATRALLRRRFARDFGLLMGADGIALAIAAVQGILVARWLGPEDYGVVALVMVYPQAIRMVLDARTEEASIRYLGEFHVRGSREKASAIVLMGYLIDLAVSLLAFAVVAATAALAATELVHDADEAGLLIVVAGALVFASASYTSRAVLRTLGDFPVLAAVRVSVAALGAGLVLALVQSGAGVEGAVWGLAATLAFEGVVLLVLGLRATRRTWGLVRLGVAWQAVEGRRRELGSFLAWTNVGALIALIPSQLALLLVGAISGQREAGYYRLAQSLTSIANLGLMTLRSIVYPRLAAIGGDMKPRLFAAVRRYALLVGAPLGIAAMLSIPLVPLIVPALVGSAYDGAIPAAQIMLGAAALWIAFFWLRPLYLTLGEAKLHAQTYGAASLLALVAFVSLIPPFGAEGAAIAVLFLALITYPLQLWLLRRKYGVRILHPGAVGAAGQARS